MFFFLIPVQRNNEILRVCFFEMIGIQEVSYFYYEVRILVHLQDKGRIFLGQM